MTEEPIASVLARAGINPRRPTCPSPGHQDKRPGSVSIFTGRDGKERLYCHSCHLSEDSWGLQVLLGERPEPKREPMRLTMKLRRRKRKERARMENLLREKPELVPLVITATTLATIPRSDALKEVMYLKDEPAQAGFILGVSDRIRRQTCEHFGEDKQEDQSWLQVYVPRFLAVLEKS